MRLDKKLIEVRPVSNFNKDILITLGLLTNNKYNVAAQLIADENKNMALGIDIVRFGHSISEFVDRRTITGKSILSQYDGALEMFIKHYPEIEKVEITRQDVESLLKVNKTKAVEMLNKLVTNGLVKSAGTGKNVVYIKKDIYNRLLNHSNILNIVLHT
ncbi:MAG: hypothetical protein WC014_02970 [Bacilli bacterium]